VKRLISPWTCVCCGLVLLNVFILAGAAAGQLSLNPSTVNFGSIQVGSKASQTAMLSNTGSANLTITGTTTSGAGFSISQFGMPLTLAPAQSVSVMVNFAPQSGGGNSGAVSFAYSVQKNKSHGKGYGWFSNAATLNLAGSGIVPGQLSASPTGLNFGTAQVGNSLTLMDALTNTGGNQVTISDATVTGAGFSINGLSVPLVLNPGASVTFSAVFAPQSAGTASGSINVASNGSNSTLAISLNGAGVAQGQLTLTPAALDFGNVTVGASASQTNSLVVSGASVTVSSASLSGGEFSLSGISFPLTIAPGQSLPFTVSFAPQTSGTASATLSFASNALSAPTESLTGTGQPQTQHSADLSWTDDGPGVVGYNVYRGGASGGPYIKINTALEPNTAYNDANVQGGQTYYYVSTAVDGNGKESAYSNEAQVAIPTP